MATKTIVIAGGAGFLGSHLCDVFLGLGYKVVAVDNVSTGSKNNVLHLMNNKDFTLVEHDLCEALPEELTSLTGVEVVANLASPASPPHYQRLSVETLRVNSVGVQNLLDFAKDKKARYFQASTSEVYGDPQVHPQPESYWGNVNSYGPRSMYDEGKRFAEAMIYVYREKHGLDTGIVRIFNTYGPRMDAKDGRVVSNLITQAINNQPMTIYGDGSQTRSFCYVSDLIEGFRRMILSDVEGPVNLGNPKEFTMLELADMVKKLTGSKSEIIFKPLPGDDPLQRQPAIDRAKKELDWEPTVQLEEGLKKTIEYFASLQPR
jgi:UDP-glucuronate decarboxylase